MSLLTFIAALLLAFALSYGNRHIAVWCGLQKIPFSSAEIRLEQQMPFAFINSILMKIVAQGMFTGPQAKLRKAAGQQASMKFTVNIDISALRVTVVIRAIINNLSKLGDHGRMLLIAIGVIYFS
ncbi:hypothetical protein [Duffyella gerundensis]|uniref:hypothetical protein n=1 Tax=Duffyella gerundensis TaxID=1619313 RepID=UPI0021F7123F|nr:hypothetical protein [Duffyella gerundensis]